MCIRGNIHTKIRMIDFMLFSHVEPGTVAESRLQKWKQWTLKDDVENFFSCFPFFAVNEVAANVNKVFDLLIPLLFVLKILCNIESDSDLA